MMNANVNNISTTENHFNYNGILSIMITTNTARLATPFIFSTFSIIVIIDCVSNALFPFHSKVVDEQRENIEKVMAREDAFLQSICSGHFSTGLVAIVFALGLFFFFFFFALRLSLTFAELGSARERLRFILGTLYRRLLLR